MAFGSANTKVMFLLEKVSPAAKMVFHAIFTPFVVIVFFIVLPAAISVVYCFGRVSRIYIYDIRFYDGGCWWQPCQMRCQCAM